MDIDYLEDEFAPGIDTKEIRQRLIDQRRLKNIQNSLCVVDGEVFVRSVDVSLLFSKSHEIVAKELSGISDKYGFKLRKADIWVVFNSEVEVTEIHESLQDQNGLDMVEREKIECFYLDWIMWGVLVNSYVSKRACKIKVLWIEAIMRRMCEIKELSGKYSLACMELKISEPGAILKNISEKIDLLSIDLAKFMKKNKRRELTKEEKLYQEIRINKIKSKVEMEARKKLADIRNKQIKNKNNHNLIYDMQSVYEEEKRREEVEYEKQEALRNIGLRLNGNNNSDDGDNSDDDGGLGNENSVDSMIDSLVTLTQEQPPEKDFENNTTSRLETEKQRDRVGFIIDDGNENNILFIKDKSQTGWYDYVVSEIKKIDKELIKLQAIREDKYRDGLIENNGQSREERKKVNTIKILLNQIGFYNKNKYDYRRYLI